MTALHFDRKRNFMKIPYSFRLIDNKLNISLKTLKKKPTFGPKLITGGDQGSEQNYSYHQPQQNQNQRPMSVYETRQIQPKLNRANSDASLSSYRPYQMYQTGQNRFGSQMNLQQSGKLSFLESINYLL